MKKRRLLLLSLSVMLVLSLSLTTVFAFNFKEYSPKKSVGNGQFDYDGNYVAPELKIDGVGDDAKWQELDWFYKDIKSGDAGVADPATANVKMYLGDSALYIYFEVIDHTPFAVADANQTDEVTQGDSVEFYLCTSVDAAAKPQKDDYQINIDINGFSRLMQGTGAAWQNLSTLLVDYEIAKNDNGYGVELMFPYSQSGMRKGDDIAFCFGLVDKYSEDQGKHTWTGVTGVDAQCPATYKVLSGRDGKIYDMGEQDLLPVTLTGKVKDESGNALALTTYTYDGVDYLTGSDGTYKIENVIPRDAEITFKKQGYVTNKVSLSKNKMIAAKGGEVKNDVTMRKITADMTTTLKGRVVTIDFPVEGVQVTAGGKTVVTDAEGKYTIEGLPYNANGYTITTNSEKYGEKTTLVSLVEADGITNVDDIDVLIFKDIYNTTFGGARGIAGFKPHFARLENGIAFRFNATTAGWKNGGERIELFLDAGTESLTTIVDRNTSDRVFISYLYADGRKDVFVSLSNVLDSESVIYKVVGEGLNKYAVVYYPYEFLGITKDSVIGISLGSFSGSDWDGWGVDALPGYNGIGFVAPEIPADYIRIGTDNSYFNNDKNEMIGETEKPVEVIKGSAPDMTGYVSFNKQSGDAATFGGNNGTLVFAPGVKRDGNAVKFAFVTDISEAQLSELGNKFIECFFDFGQKERNGSTVELRDNTCYRINLSLAGLVSVVQYGGDNNSTLAESNVKLENSVLEMYYKDGKLYVMLNLDLTKFGLDSTKVIGVSFGSGASGWDGWSVDGIMGVNNLAYVAPEHPNDYIRVGVGETPEIYWASSNVAQKDN